MELETRTRAVGQVTADVWERFDRLQATAAELLGHRRHPGGVFRFRTLEEFERWNRQLSLQLPEPPVRTTSSGSAAS